MNFTIRHRGTIFRGWLRVKHPEAAIAAVLALAGMLWLVPSVDAISPGAAIHEERMEDFSPDEYRAGVERLFKAFEAERGERLRRGELGSVGLKVYTGSGPGLSTPVALVRGVVDALLERGYAPENIFLVDLDEHRLRKSGFLPNLREGGKTFGKHPVYVLETGQYYDDTWFYDSPLPPRREGGRGTIHRREFSYEPSQEDRRSYLPKPLLLDVDFWINLPVYTDHPALGVNGALVNATLWNASNTSRFFQSETSGAAAAAEMAAVPELAENWLFTIFSLERYQFMGGPFFRSLYTSSEPVLMLSADPVALDSRMYRKINERRKDRGFEPAEEGMNLLDYAAQLKLGRPERVERARGSGEDSEPTEP